MDKRLYELLIRTFKTRSFNAYDFAFFCDEEAKPSESCMHIGSRVFIVSPKLMENCGFWCHEFSELTLIEVFERWNQNWQKFVKFKGFKKTSPVHLISPFGMNNGRSLFPQKSKKIPKF